MRSRIIYGPHHEEAKRRAQACLAQFLEEKMREHEKFNKEA